MTHFAKKFIGLSALLLTLVACSHGPQVVSTANPIEEVSRFGMEVDTAAGNQLNVVSPKHFKSAQSELEKAQGNLERRKDSQEVLRHVARGREHLRLANRTAGFARANMEEVIVARERALAAGGPRFYGEEFRDVDKDLRSVGLDLENNDPRTAATRRSELQSRYLRIEMRSIKAAHLGPARARIDQAIKEDAEKYAPRSLAIAKKSYVDADAFISGHPHDERARWRADAAVANAEHLLRITRAAKAGENISSEELALQRENERQQARMKEMELQAQGQLQGQQVQEKMAATQAATEEELAARDAQIREQQARLQEEQNAAARLTSENETMAREREFQSKFEQAQTQFAEDEAEVYRQGDRLIIRLKGLEFPTAQALLKGSNLPLLAKVQKIIRDFGESSVTVEGHTDSQGSRAANVKLSLDRAEAVKEYLVSSDAVNEDKITAVGAGFDKPLASNKTGAGRAQNRRVDVLIEPEMTEVQ